MVSVRKTTGDTWLARVTLSTIALVGTSMEWALRYLRQIGTQKDSRCNSSYVSVGTMEVGSWGPHAGSANMWTHMQCPQMPVLPSMLMVPNRGMVTLHVVQTGPQTSSRQNSLDAVGSEPGEGMTPFPTFLFPLESVQGSWSNPDITTPKLVYFQVAVTLVSSPFVIIPIALSMILDLTMNRTFSE